VINVSDEAYKYLTVQVGEISELADSRAHWMMRYDTMLLQLAQDITPHLPGRVRNILDVGSGLGGIDILLSRYYGSRPDIILLDGDNEVPKVYRHNMPFNSMRVAREFLKANGVNSIVTMTPETLKPRKVDLIVSFRAYAFHIRPLTYMDFVLNCAHHDTVLIFEVRRDKPEWREDLDRHFDHTVIQTGRKADLWRMKLK
jgi:hypothetical protein